MKQKLIEIINQLPSICLYFWMILLSIRETLQLSVLFISISGMLLANYTLGIEINVLKKLRGK